MEKILSLDQAFEISKKLRSEKKNIVLAGGCFDILHIGHVHFIQKAKEEGDVLFLLLESDEAIREKKGEGRPINNQKTRAHILAALQDVDFIVLLPKLENTEYDAIISSLAPSVIATTEGDTQKFHKERQAKVTKAKLIEVVSVITDSSTTKIAKLLSKEL